MEDWEEFFLEKSIRRSEKVRRRQKAYTLPIIIGGALLLCAITAILYLMA